MMFGFAHAAFDRRMAIRPAGISEAGLSLLQGMSASQVRGSQEVFCRCF